MNFVAILLFAIPLATADHALITKEFVMGKTRWGEWSNTLLCGKVAGFRLRVEKYQGGGDDTALNGIQLRCLDGKVTGQIKGHWGDWKGWKMCPKGQYVTAFQLKSEASQGSGDDTAANDVRMRCSDNTLLEGDGLYHGRWQKKECPAGSYLCAVKARVESKRGGNDDTGLNQIKFTCCNVRITERIILGRTGWGKWSNTLICDNFAKVSGFRLRVEHSRGSGDDTALNGIQLRCSDGKSTGRINGIWGDWKNWKTCRRGQYVTAFNVRSERAQGHGDDTGANDVKMRCSDNRVLKGDGMGWGTWESRDSNCPVGSFLCGVDAKEEPKQGIFRDDTALNQLRFICCGY